MTAESALGSSEFQGDCAEYYRLLRSVHSSTFTSPKRKAEELTKTRYKDANYPGIKNLNSFIEILHRLLGDGPNIRGIDFGCGSHWFTDHVRSEFGWSAVGYDPDPGAIDFARKQFPENADFYRCRDMLREGFPEADATQHFAFCNAVIQHFDDAETEQAIAEMARVLRPGGYCLLIFKRWLPELATPQSGLDEPLKILDAAQGKVMFLDPTMKRAIDQMEPADQAKLGSNRKDGWRMLHLFPVEKVAEMASRHDLTVAPTVPLENGDLDSGVIAYRSGKKIPTACIYFQKSDGKEKT